MIREANADTVKIHIFDLIKVLFSIGSVTVGCTLWLLSYFSNIEHRIKETVNIDIKSLKTDCHEKFTKIDSNMATKESLQEVSRQILTNTDKIDRLSNTISELKNTTNILLIKTQQDNTSTIENNK